MISSRISTKVRRELHSLSSSHQLNISGFCFSFVPLSDRDSIIYAHNMNMNIEQLWPTRGRKARPTCLHHHHTSRLRSPGQHPGKSPAARPDLNPSLTATSTPPSACIRTTGYRLLRATNTRGAPFFVAELAKRAAHDMHRSLDGSIGAQLP